MWRHECQLYIESIFQRAMSNLMRASQSKQNHSSGMHDKHIPDVAHRLGMQPLPFEDRRDTAAHSDAKNASVHVTLDYTSQIGVDEYNDFWLRLISGSQSCREHPH
jgi:hypothetical protein